MKRLIEKKVSNLDLVIEELLNKMKETDVTADDYKKMTDNLLTLCKAKEHTSSNDLSRNEILKGLVNVGGLLLVLNFERLNVITSKAFGRLLR